MEILQLSLILSSCMALSVLAAMKLVWVAAVGSGVGNHGAGSDGTPRCPGVEEAGCEVHGA